ncbi:MAG: aminoacyl-tRNA hydrolase [Spirochaetales bacterium]|nr:aminoacyl-tRNA hydrolase [Spirochaetales bacterium]
MGNPGEKYYETRHNAGFAVINYLSEIKKIKLKKAFMKSYFMGLYEDDTKKIFILKPTTFMNRSGDIIRHAMNKTNTNVEDLVLICDNMDLKPGMIRLKSKGSAAGHNGIKSVIYNIGTSEFKRLYIGVGRPDDNSKVVDHVLGTFNNEDKILFDESVKNAAEALLLLTEKPINQVMNEINKRNN